MQQKHNWFVHTPDGGTYTLLATPLAGAHKNSMKREGKNVGRTLFQAFTKPDSSIRMSTRVKEDRPLAVTTLYQLYEGEHGTTRLVVVCRIEEGIEDAKEAKKGGGAIAGRSD